MKRMTCYQLQSVLLGTVRCCFCLNSKGGRYYTKAWTGIIGGHLSMSLSELKKIYLESQGRLHITSGHCGWNPCGWKIDWENSFSDVRESEGRLDRLDKVRSQRVSLHELRSIPKGWVSHQEVPWSEIHGIHVILAARQQVGGAQETGKHVRWYTLNVTWQYSSHNSGSRVASGYRTCSAYTVTVCISRIDLVVRERLCVFLCIFKASRLPSADMWLKVEWFYNWRTLFL